MRHWYYTLVLALIGCAAAVAVAAAPDTPARPERRVRPERPARTAQTTPRHDGLHLLMAGNDGTKPLYGISLCDNYVSNYGGPLDGYSGPAQIDANGNHSKLKPSVSFMTQSGCYYDGNFISIYRNWGTNLIEYRFYDAETWNPVGTGTVNYTFSSPNVFPSDVTYDPTTKRLYGTFLEDTGKGFAIGSNFGYIDLTPGLENWTEPVKVIKDLGISMRGIASTVDGDIYGIGEDLKLYRINKVTGALAEVGAIDFEFAPTTDMLGYDSADIDFETGDIYFFYTDENWDTYIVKIDPATAHSTVAANFAYDAGGNVDQFPAIFFKQHAAVTAVTPDKVTDLTIAADGVALAANVEFTMPANDTDGNALSGNVDWNVLNGETVLASGSAAPGTAVKTHVDVAQRGITTFVVYASLGSQVGSPQAQTVFIGNDMPVITGRPLVGGNGTDMQIIWDAAVAEHADMGGNLAPVTYKVVRRPDNAVVVANTSALKASDVINVEYKTRFNYEVTPTSGAFTGQAVSSRPFYSGKYFELPYDDDFVDDLLFSEYRQIDANEDFNYWWIDADKSRVVYSSTSVDANDYLCLGPFNLTAGSKYNFSMLAGGHGVSERVAVYVGTDPNDVSTFTEELVAPTYVNPSQGNSHLAGSFIPTTSGIYYFGIAALSPSGHQNLYVYDVHVAEASSKVPAAVTDLKATPADAGMVISGVLPATTIGGDKANVTSLIIKRDKQQVAEVTEGITDGATFSWTDTETAADGQHVYTVAALNAAGIGDEVSCNAWWGEDRPARPVNMRVWEDLDTPGLMHVTWEAPAYGFNGGKIDQNNIDWVIDWLSLGQAGSGLRHMGSKCRFDLQLGEDAIKEQDLIAFTVYGVNHVGSSERDGRLTRSAYFGPATSLPIRESWVDFRYAGIWSGEALKEDAELFESYWDISSGSTLGIKPYNDNCMYALTTTVDGGGYRTRSPRLTIGDETNPVLVFYFYYTEATKDFQVEIAVDDQPMKTLRNLDVSAAGANEWKRIEIPLSEYRNAKYFQFGFSGHATTAASEFCAIDNLSVLDLKEFDLTVMKVEATNKLNATEDAVIDVTIRNSGSKDVNGSSYKVNLIKNGKVVDQQAGEDLLKDGELSLTFLDLTSVADPANTVYNIEVVYDADQNPADNRGTEVTTVIVPTRYPAVDNLTGRGKTGVTLWWSQPERVQILPDPAIESFEDYEAFTITDFGDWKVYDGDGHNTIIIQTSLGVLSYPNIGKPMAWQVIDPYEAGILANAWTPRSGLHMLVSFQASTDGGRDVKCDDWLISPELFGGAQRVSFMACTAMSTYAPEIIDVLYSTTGTEIADFKPLAQNVEVPFNSVDWTEMAFDLPEGARHFAIVHKSDNKFALMIDDVKYIPAGSDMLDLTLQGFNVFRDGVQINDELVTEQTYNDATAVDGQEYTYHVSTVWDKGESPLSNALKVTASAAIGDIAADNSDSITIATIDGGIRVAGAAGLNVAVYTTTGVCVVSTVAPDDVTDIRVVPGFYIVNAGGKTAKVFVGNR